LEKFNKKLNVSVNMEQEVKEMFLRHDWPGNIRELENLIERMILLAQNDTVTMREIPEEFKAAVNKIAAAPLETSKKPFKNYMRDHVENVEKQMIVKMLEEAGGNVTKAAQQLGLSRKGLQLKMIKYNLRKDMK